MTITLNRRGALTAFAIALLLAMAYVLGTSRPTGTAYASGPPTKALAVATSSDADHITVSATGTATGTPDTVLTSFSVRETSNSLNGAVNGANAAASRVQKALKDHGVTAKDFQTSNVSLYSYLSGPKGGPRTRHYVMTESLTATLRSIDDASGQIQAAITAGGSTVSLDGVSLDLKDDSALLSTARTDAFNSAKTKATQYAGLAGRPLGAVSSITETVNEGIGPRQDFAYASAVPASGMSYVPLAAGSQDVGVTVTVVFALG